MGREVLDTEPGDTVLIIRDGVTNIFILPVPGRWASHRFWLDQAIANQ